MNLNQLRTKIDQVDQQLINLLAERKKVVLEIAQFKKENYLKVKDKQREKELLEKRKQFAQKLGLGSKFVKNIYQLILKNSRRVQK